MSTGFICQAAQTFVGWIVLLSLVSKKAEWLQPLMSFISVNFTQKHKATHFPLHSTLWNGYNRKSKRKIGKSTRNMRILSVSVLICEKNQSHSICRDVKFARIECTPFSQSEAMKGKRKTGKTGQSRRDISTLWRIKFQSFRWLSSSLHSSVFPGII